MKQNRNKNYFSLVVALLLIVVTANVVTAQQIKSVNLFISSDNGSSFPGVSPVITSERSLHQSGELSFANTIAIAADLDQCRNGSNGTDQCTGSNWHNGNLNSMQAGYVEGEFIPYRMKITGAAGDGTTVNTLMIEYDTSQNQSGSGKHAIDYIGTYNFNETNADPCDYTGCPFGTPHTFPVPFDPLVTNGQDGSPGGGDDITQIPGVVTIWGGTITNVTLGTFTGSFAGASMRQIIITFTSTVPNPVIAWGGHISTRLDWGINNSAVSINGSPYHMRLISINGDGGNQDRALMTDAVTYPAVVKIIKVASPQNPQDFTFTTTGLTPSGFTLDDDGGSDNDGVTNMVTYSNIVAFGAGNPITVTEDMVASWQIRSGTGIQCTEVSGGLGSMANTTVNIGTRTANIIAEEGEFITCTFTNDLLSPSAASATISGRVINSSGRGLKGVLITATALSTGEKLYTSPDSYGIYRFEDLPVGDSYLITIKSRYFRFEPDSRIITLNGDFADVDFTAVTPVKTRGDK